MINAIGLLVVLCLGLCRAQYTCPEDLVKPCSCRGPDWNNDQGKYKVVVRCDGFAGDINLFAEILSKLDNYEIDDLVINNYRNARLPDQPFTNTIIRRIIISNSPLLEAFSSRSVDSETSFFTNLGAYLETLVITNTQNIRYEEWPSLADSLAVNETAPGEGPALKNLIFFRNDRSSVSNINPFVKLVQLEKITLRSIGLSGPFSADLSVFAELKLLDLSENQIKNFSSALPPKLTTIYLNNNLIEIFEKGFFDNLGAVGYVNVKSNRLNCQCDYIQQIVDSQPLQDVFDGTCLSPPIMKKKPYGVSCFTSFY